MDRRPITDLRGMKLWLVGFAPDGVYVRFAGPDGPELRARQAPTIETGEGPKDTRSPDYKDALCGSLSARLVDGYWTADEIVLGFDDGKLRLSPADDTNGLAPEVAELHADGLWIFGRAFFNEP
jgi:hypothetical protein